MRETVSEAAVVVRSADVARAAGVSRSTVSQILNGKGDLFSEATRELVLRMAASLNYEPSAAARTLATGSSDFIIALVPHTTFGGNLQDLFEPATRAFAAQGYSLVLRLASENPASLGRMVSSMKPRAVMSLAAFTAAEREVLDATGVPAFGADAEDMAAFDSHFGAIQAEHLHQQGYQQLAFAHLRDERQDPFGAGRETGVRTYCREHGLPEPAVVHLGINRPQAVEALDALPTSGIGIACYNDDVATALLAAALDRRLRVPEDVALIGMDHTPLSGLTTPPLTTVSYDVTAGGRALVAIVLAGLSAEQTPTPWPDLAVRVVRGGTT